MFDQGFENGRGVADDLIGRRAEDVFKVTITFEDGETKQAAV